MKDARQTDAARVDHALASEVIVKRTTAVLATAGLLAACTDRPGPMGVDPGDPAVPTTTEELSTGSAAASLPSALIPVEDALNRVLDALPQGPANEELRAALVELSEALEAEDSCAIRTSRRKAEHALRALGRGQPEEYEADLEVVKLALESVEQSGKGKC